MKPIIPLLFIQTVVQPLIQIGVLNRRNETSKATAELMLSYAKEKFEGDIDLKLVVYNNNPLGLYDAVCRLADMGVMAVISWGSSGVVIREADILSQLHIPLISISASSPGLKSSNRDYLLRLAPSDSHQAEVIFDILRHFNWTRFSILSSNDDYGLQGLIKLQQLASLDARFTIVTVQYFKSFHKTENAEIDITAELQAIKESMSTIVVLNCQSVHGRSVLQQAAKLAMLDLGYAWITTDSLTAVSQNLARNDGSYPGYLNGLIGTAPALASQNGFQTFQDEFIRRTGDDSILNIWSTTVYDAIDLAYHAYKTSDIFHVEKGKPSCSAETPWERGSEFIDMMKSTKFDGVTGEISFLQSGVINRTSYVIRNFYEGKFVDIGYWTSQDSLVIHDSNIHFFGGQHDSPNTRKNTLSGRHLKFGIIEDPPFAFKNDSKECQLDDHRNPKCWYGFVIDLNERFATDVNFTYELVQSPDGKYGSYDRGLNRFTGNKCSG